MPMLQRSDRTPMAVPHSGFEALDLDQMHDPQMLECFMASSRCGCFMQAARSLNLSAPTLRKKLARLEARLGSSLFEHSEQGVALSSEGRRLQGLLQERLADAAARSEGGRATPCLRLAVSEPLLQDILGRNLVAFVRQHAGVRMDISAHATPDTDLLLCLADDASTCPALPFACRQPERLAVLGYQPYIAKRYCREANRPTSVQALCDYMLVQWTGDAQVSALAPWHQVLAGREAGLTELAGYDMFVQMIRCSASIGLLPQYTAKLDRSLIPLPGVFDVPMRRGVWLAINAQSSRSPMVQGFVQTIRSAFSEREDWF